MTYNPPNSPKKSPTINIDTIRLAEFFGGFGGLIFRIFIYYLLLLFFNK